MCWVYFGFSFDFLGPVSFCGEQAHPSGRCQILVCWDTAGMQSSGELRYIQQSCAIRALFQMWSDIFCQDTAGVTSRFAVGGTRKFGCALSLICMFMMKISMSHFYHFKQLCACNHKYECMQMSWISRIFCQYTYINTHVFVMNLWLYTYGYMHIYL